jgi:ATP-dependent helicase HrpA
LLAASAVLGRALFDEVADRAVADALESAGAATPRNAAEFEALVDIARQRVADSGAEVLRVARATLAALKEARAPLKALGAAAFEGPRQTVQVPLDALVAPGWVRRTPEPWFHQLPKYVRAAQRRAERMRNDIERDRKLYAQVAPYESALRALDRAADPSCSAPEREKLRWMLEEYRVSLFAQELRTLMPISAKRLDEQLRLARGK